MTYEFIKEGPHGESPGTIVEGRDIKMNGLVTTDGIFIPWHYLRPVERRHD